MGRVWGRQEERDRDDLSGGRAPGLPPPPRGAQTGTAGVLKARRRLGIRNAQQPGRGAVLVGSSLRPPDRNQSQVSADSARNAQGTYSWRRGRPSHSSPRTSQEAAFFPLLGIGLSKSQTCSGAFQGILNHPEAGLGLGIGARSRILRAQRRFLRL